FFQAEDGIRDLIVTGVQTCALPISTRQRAACGRASWRGARCERNGTRSVCAARRTAAERWRAAPCRRARPETTRARTEKTRKREIGRASCREREEREVGGGEVERKE